MCGISLKLMFNPEIFIFLCEALWDTVFCNHIKQVFGLGTSGAPFSVGILVLNLE